MRVTSRHSDAARGHDAYWTPPEATYALLRVERDNLRRRRIFEPAAGNGAIAKVFRDDGFSVVTADIRRYRFKLDYVEDYLAAPRRIRGRTAIVTNPPFKSARAFLGKALLESEYVALLLRLQFLESASRIDMFRMFPPSRVWVSSRRLPMMHRYGWKGKRASSNIPYAWFIWQRGDYGARLNWFDWL